MMMMMMMTQQQLVQYVCICVDGYPAVFNTRTDSSHKSKHTRVGFVWSDSIRFDSIRLIIVTAYGNSQTTTYKSIH